MIAGAADLATGQPLDHIVRSCAIAWLFSERIGIDPEQRESTYWVSLLMLSGCSAVSFEVSKLFGDDVSGRSPTPPPSRTPAWAKVVRWLSEWWSVGR